ncbi:hypothetical protein [uncultured Mailhella sp.]|uniref:hypothetical protein n=1 Tax=uncultured Mailhella sp. TaxID=1981031 RepID=UPI0032081EA8
MGADRGAPATREATEKENTAAAKLREEVCREKSRILPQHPQHRAFLSGKMPVAARTLLGLAGAVFFQAEDPLKEKHRSGGVGRTKFSEVDRGVSRNIVLAGSARCCFALRVIRLTGLHASQGLAFFEGSNSLSFDFQSAPQHEGRKKASSCAVEELLRLRAMFSAILPPSPGEKAAECAGELVGRFCLRQAEKIRQGVRRASRAEGMAHQQGRAMAQVLTSSCSSVLCTGVSFCTGANRSGRVNLSENMMRCFCRVMTFVQRVGGENVRI